MEKYKYIGNERENRIPNKTYDGESKINPWCYSVSELAIKFPYEWQLIQEKSPEELLIEEAKRRYPIGTEFYSALPGDLNPARLTCNGGYRFQEDVHGCKNVIWNKDHNNRECGFLYCNGTWAETINKNSMCTEKTIKLSLDQAKKMYGKNSEMDELLLANFSKEELTKKELPKSWSELNKDSIKGFYIEAHNIRDAANNGTSLEHRISRFTTKKIAKSALAMAQLSQLIAVYNNGWEFKPDGNFKITSHAYVLIRKHNEIKQDYFENNWAFLAFKSAELRDEFLKNFESLIKEYFMID